MIFAKCHHGMNYYPTRIEPVHPSLQFDLLGQQIEACHRAGIRCPIYLSVVWDVPAAERRPIVHAQRRATGHVEALAVPVPLHNVSLKLKTTVPISRVFLAASGESLLHSEAEGAVSVTVPRVDAHAVVVFGLAAKQITRGATWHSCPGFA